MCYRNFFSQNLKISAVLLAILVSNISLAANKKGDFNFTFGASMSSLTNSEDDKSNQVYKFTNTDPDKPANEKTNVSTGNMFKAKRGYGIELGANYFIKDYLSLAADLTLPRENRLAYGTFWNDSTREFAKYNQSSLAFSAQIHFAQPESLLTPYLGAGINFTNFSSFKIFNTNFYEYSHSKTSIGEVLQAGFNYEFSPKNFFNFEIKQPISKLKFKAKAKGDYDSTSNGYNGKDGDYAIGTYTRDLRGNTNLRPIVISAKLGFKF